MKNLKKFLALGLSMVLIVSSLTACSVPDTTLESTAAESEEVAAIESALDEFDGVSELINHSDTAGKEETVYAILNADGNLEQTIVSEWLKNADGSTTIEDRSDLENITVVKGNSEYTSGSSEDQIIWSTDGSDIYYQGTSEKELPVEVKVSYELDGKKVTADELSGASGHLKITFAYENHLSKETTIHGEKRTIYQPFTMISGLMLDNSKAKNVTVDHGSTVNSGDDTIVFGLAMPGLAESLGLDDITDEDGQLIDLEIPEEVNVEADVTDFSLMMTLTIASNTALSQLGLDDIDSIDDLKADMEQLTDGMDEIIDGASQLNDGAGELKDGTGTLSAGTQTLADGTSTLSNGAHQVSEGAAQVNDGAVALKNGLDSLKGSAPELVSGVDSLTKGADQLSSGFETIIGNNDTLNAGAASLASGLSELNSSLTNEGNKQQLNALASGSAEFSQKLSQASDGLSQITAGYSYSDGDLAALMTGLEQYADALASTEDPANAAYAGYIKTMLETYKGLYNNVSSAQNGVSALSDAYSTINSGISAAIGSISTVSQAVGQLSEGAGSLKDEVVSYTNGVSQASAGIKTLDEGLNSLNSKVPALVSGIDQLSNGANTLADGTGTLSQGASSLANGADQINSGTSELKSGVSKLLEGVNELANGTGDLKDGVIKFNEEGISKLADVVNNNLETYYDRLKAVQDYAEEYTSFAGCEKDVECSVKFIYKTDSID